MTPLRSIAALTPRLSSLALGSSINHLSLVLARERHCFALISRSFSLLCSRLLRPAVVDKTGAVVQSTAPLDLRSDAPRAGSESSLPLPSSVSVWVSASAGNDSNAGSKSMPFKTLRKALEEVTSRAPGGGGSVVVREGMYYGVRPFPAQL
jgi:hypothetical protein